MPSILNFEECHTAAHKLCRFLEMAVTPKGQVSLDVCMSVCMDVCMFVCMFAFMFLCMYVYKYIYIYACFYAYICM